MKKVTILVCLLAISLIGCAEVQMSPRMQQLTRMSAVNVSAMSKDCQDGNDESCTQGLIEASKTLNLIVEAME